MLHPLDEYPVHQTPESMSRVGTSDKNFYDRCYFNAHDRTGDTFVITGLGTYANLGVVDAYGDADWAHGQWKGAGWAESVVVDLNDPAVAPAHPVRQHRPRRSCGL